MEGQEPKLHHSIESTLRKKLEAVGLRLERVGVQNPRQFRDKKRGRKVVSPAQYNNDTRTPHHHLEEQTMETNAPQTQTHDGGRTQSTDDSRSPVDHMADTLHRMESGIAWQNSPKVLATKALAITGCVFFGTAGAFWFIQAMTKPAELVEAPVPGKK